jgi:hypothetical protein
MDIEREISPDPLWIGLVGAAQAGKTTVADRLGEFYVTTSPYLAKPIKGIAQRYYGMSEVDCYSQEGKSKEHSYMTFEDGTAMTNRQVLEQVGDKLQELDPLVLLRAAESRLEKEEKLRLTDNSPGLDPEVVLFPDLRTEPQADFIRDHGGIVVYVARDHAEEKAEAIKDAHHTKTFYNRTEHDLMIDNNGGLEQLWDEVYRLVSAIRHLKGEMATN